MNCRQCVLRGRNIFIQFQRLERAGFGFEEEIAAGAQTEQPLINIRLRKVRVSLSVIGVDSNCLSIKVGAPRQVHRGKFLVQIICPEGKLVSLRIDLHRPTWKQQFWINQFLNLAPERITDPSTTASTRNSLAISARDLPARLYRITDVREMTRNRLIREMAAMSSSVMPSEKYSWDGSPERLSSGSTARESMRGARGGSIGPCSSSRATAVTWARKRYPRCGRVSMKRGLSALSPRASRSLLIALFSPRPKSTKVLSGQSLPMSCSRTTTSPACSSRITRI